MNSLYGGRPGASFVVKASFKSVAEMVEAFQKGPNYTDVWYEEYCIIDCPNKNDKTNGTIYRRGLDYQNTMGGAERIGQVVGPSSGTPYFQLASLQTIQELSKSKQTNDYTTYKRYPTGINSDGTYKTNGDSGEQNKNIFIGEYGHSESERYSLVPGKYQDGDVTKYRDTIKYSWLNLRMDNADSDSWFYVGFEVPYLVTDYTIHAVSQYDENGNIRTDATDIERIDDESHPFYSKWDLGVPKGIKGDTIRNLRVMAPTTATKVYPISALGIDPKTSLATVNTSQEYEGKADDVDKQRQIVVFDYYIYDKVMNPTPYTFYIGDFNIIKSITTQDDGTVEIEYTHNNKDPFNTLSK